MRLTKHAETRKQQRGFSSLSLDIIQEYGRCEKAPGGAVKFFFGEKEYRNAIGDLRNTIQFTAKNHERNTILKTIQVMERAKGGKVIIKDGYVITAYK